MKLKDNMNSKPAVEILCEKFESYFNYEALNVNIEESHSDLLGLLINSYEDLMLNKKYSVALEKATVVQDRTWELLNIGRWCDVPFGTRKIYATASLIKVCCVLRLGVGGDEMSVLSEALSTTDDGLLMGAGLKSQLTKMASALSDAIHSEWVKRRGGLDIEKILDFIESPGDWDLPGIKGELLPSLQCPSLEAFSLAHYNPQIPVKLTGCIGHWPALNKWKDVNYLLRVGGGRKVPVEIGSQYTKSDWSMKLCKLREFITDHIINKQPKIGYLAQHQLFNQVSELNDDIRVPEYCCLSESDNEPIVDINAWFGPQGTVSPLHHDPKHNFLTQVVGRKRILLYSPENSPYLYPFDGKILFNTSEVDPESPDYTKFPEFAKVIAYECHLYPGEMLYIPPKWWHHVRALDVSFSVSFWWE